MSELSKTEAMRQISTEDAADLLGVSHASMEIWRRKGIGPRYIRMNNSCVRYRLGDLADFQDHHLVENVAKR